MASYPLEIQIAADHQGGIHNYTSSIPRFMMTQSSEIPDQLAMTGIGQRPATTVTRADLIDAVYRTVGLSRAESAQLVELVLKEITDCLGRGETVKLASFGSFVVRSKGPRTGRNPKTGVPAPIPPHRAIVFKPSDVLRERLRSEQATD